MYLILILENNEINPDFTKVTDSYDKAFEYMVKTAKDDFDLEFDTSKNCLEIEKEIKEELEFTKQNISIHYIQKV
ncbi:MAG: hypothetical protein K9K32_00090 [Halanaerobiales bacterium]|nr:hypothetical protein [Halanaerobiales bacterium]